MVNLRTTFVMCLALGAGLLSSQPASATNARQAMLACDNNPKCNYQVDRAGGVDICIQGAHSPCDTWVSCPPKGQCQVMRVKGTKLGAP